jgi:hypothetical protein
MKNQQKQKTKKKLNLHNDSLSILILFIQFAHSNEIKPLVSIKNHIQFILCVHRKTLFKKIVALREPVAIKSMVFK